jgi:integrase
VDFERGRIRLDDPLLTTPHKGRAVVPITNTLRRVLEEAHRGALSPFVIEYGGKQVGSVKKGMAAAAKRAGIAHWGGAHDLRHSAAVHMAEAGVGPTELALFLGHKVPGMSRATSIYAKHGPDYLRDAIKALELGHE